MTFSCSAPRFELSNLASEITCLSSEALAEVNRDLYGLDEAIAENETISNALQMLDEALSCIPEKPEFMQAIEVCPEYVNSQEFRLMFLRSVSMNAEVSIVSFKLCTFSCSVTTCGLLSQQFKRKQLNE